MAALELAEGKSGSSFSKPDAGRAGSLGRSGCALHIARSKGDPLRAGLISELPPDAREHKGHVVPDELATLLRANISSLRM